MYKTSGDNGNTAAASSKQLEASVVSPTFIKHSAKTSKYLQLGNVILQCEVETFNQIRSLI